MTKWIKIKTGCELPRLNEFVKVKASYGLGEMIHYFKFEINKNTSFCQWVDADGVKYAFSVATHWKRLPED